MLSDIKLFTDYAHLEDVMVTSSGICANILGALVWNAVVLPQKNAASPSGHCS